ncbi:ACT domain-containing protein [Robiginitalea sp. M366]|uniref:ACT domain-containing protein n=1 Tax=Robiginitalea aestuariiviva TaxID=3036903 RepID=UPI00240E29B4|nr:ACT domain-containing protein [Robiginitalea aestuariiviva]MDG1572473.1 ACT domain-containing protein [Robiginitalea aestuariiviva]
MSGITELAALLREMEPKRQPGAYVFCTVPNPEGIPREATLAEFREAEGTTLVLEQGRADALDLEYDLVAAWITLTVHSALEAVGLTAAVSGALARREIACNILAGYYHDHVFVPLQDAGRAMEVLKGLSQG